MSAKIVRASAACLTRLTSLLLLLLAAATPSRFRRCDAFVVVPSRPALPVSVPAGIRGGLYSRSAAAEVEPELSHGEESDRKRVVVIGGGWAGFSAASALSAASDDTVEVVLLDASPRGRGGLAGGWRTPVGGRPVEAGIHGFWREYRNTFKVMEGIDGLNLDEVLTPYAPSVLVSKSGRVALAPVLGDAAADDEKSPGQTPTPPFPFPPTPEAILQFIAPLLPPLLSMSPSFPNSTRPRPSPSPTARARSVSSAPGPTSGRRIDRRGSVTTPSTRRIFSRNIPEFPTDCTKSWCRRSFMCCPCARGTTAPPRRP